MYIFRELGVKSKPDTWCSKTVNYWRYKIASYKVSWHILRYFNFHVNMSPILSACLYISWYFRPWKQYILLGFRYISINYIQTMQIVYLIHINIRMINIQAFQYFKASSIITKQYAFFLFWLLHITLKF